MLIDDLTIESREATENVTVVKGRQMAWMILNWLRTTESLTLVMTIEHLTHLEMQDQDLHGFITSWDNVLAHVGDQVKEETKRDMLERKLGNCKEIAEDLAHYRRME